jgi:hypothetical protein
MDRRVFLVALTVAWGCGPNEAPKKAAGASQATPTGTEGSSATQRSPGVDRPATVPRVDILVFGTRDSGTTTAPTSGATLSAID